MSKKYKLGILIGRFEPFHLGHLNNYKAATEIADKVVIFVGSSYQSRTYKNPFTFTERKSMILNAIAEQPMQVETKVLPVKDYKYSNIDWITDIQSQVMSTYPEISNDEICILGYDKDETSWYNHSFPQWAIYELTGYVEFGKVPIDATQIRTLMFEGHLDFTKGALPPTVFKYLAEFQETDIFRNLAEEFLFIKNYKASWKAAPYAPTFMCVDAVVVQGGHILMVQRKFAPGKGLWALPGGFLNQDETTEEACLRELREETRIKVPPIILQKSIVYRELFDAPDRSLRGRTLTQAFLINLTSGDGTLPKTKGGDDARVTKWFTLAEIEKMSEEIFEDHEHIIKGMVKHLK